jgi:hypothetical protein
MRDGPDGLLVSPAALDARVLAGEVGRLGAHDRVRTLGEPDGQPLRALSHPAGPPLSGGLVVARAAPGPGGQVARGDFVGPSFDIDAGGAVGDPTVARIQSKFEKSYKINVPLELLAHFELHPMFPDDVWLPKVRDLASRALATSPFGRIWIFDGERGSIRFVYPA